MKDILSALVYFLRSLRLRVGLLIFMVMVIPVIVVVSWFSNDYEQREVNSLSQSLTSQAQLISSQIVAGGYLTDTTGSISTRLNSLREMFVGRIIIMDSSMNILVDTYDMYEGKVFIWENALRAASGESITTYDSTNNIITVTLPIGSSEDIESGNIKGVIMISRNTDALSQGIMYYKSMGNTVIWVMVFLAFIFSIGFGYLLLVPLDNLNRAISSLLDGSKTKLRRGHASETMKISDGINEYSDKQRSLDKSLRDFLSNVSHELKTPLTSMKILADSLNTSEDTPVEFYREFMTDIASEIDRETAIINDLIALVKSENYESELNLSQTNVNEILERVMKTLSPLAERAKIELVLETFKPVITELDQVKFSQAMMNLIENAIKYNNEDGYVHVSINSDANSCYIRIEDNGMGIPEENLDQIFERFYRVDTSHSKEIDGTGLGLFIVKDIIIKHGGQIKVDSILNQGTTFTIKMPLVGTGE